MIPRSVHNIIGGFDDRFFMYCEDVDISWRARAAGFGVKTCPRAIYFHPVIDRPYNPEVHKRFLTSGLLLARKWGSAAFEERLRAEFVRHKLEVPALPHIAPVDAKREVADFEHMFSFGRTRW